MPHRITCTIFLVKFIVKFTLFQYMLRILNVWLCPSMILNLHSICEMRTFAMDDPVAWASVTWTTN